MVRQAPAHCPVSGCTKHWNTANAAAALGAHMKYAHPVEFAKRHHHKPSRVRTDEERRIDRERKRVKHGAHRPWEEHLFGGSASKRRNGTGAVARKPASAAEIAVQYGLRFCPNCGCPLSSIF